MAGDPNFLDDIAPDPGDGEPLYDETSSVDPDPTPADPDPAPADPDSAPADLDSDEKKSTVPLRALQEEREKRQKLAAELEDTNRSVANMESMFRRLTEESAASSEPAELEPTYEDDPDAFYHAKIAKLEARLDGVDKERTANREASEANNQATEFYNKYAGEVAEFSKGEGHGDFGDRYQWLAKDIDKDLINRGYDDPVERANIIQYEEGLMIGKAYATGKNPAAVLYKYAETRGYTPSEEGAASAELTNEDNKLARIKAGQNAAASLSGPAGKPDGGAMTLEKLIALEETDPSEFDKQWEIMRRKGQLG